MLEDERKVEDYFPFIIKVVSEVTGSYVEVENSIELSIALEKFIYANTTYNESKGNFMSYLKVLIKNGLIDYYRKQKNVQVEDSIKMEKLVEEKDNTSSVHEQVELNIYNKALKTYKLNFDKMVTHSPKHIETRRRLLKLADQIAFDEVVINHLKAKKRLPLTYITNNYDVTLKVVKTHQKFIIGVLVAYIENIEIVQDWIKQV